MSRPKRPHRQPAAQPARPASRTLDRPTGAPRPALPDDVTPELVTALAAMTRLGNAWHEYHAAVSTAASAAHVGAGSISLATRRRDRVAQMLPTEPAAAIDAAGHNALVLAAMTAAAGVPATVRG